MGGLSLGLVLTLVLVVSLGIYNRLSPKKKKKKPKTQKASHCRWNLKKSQPLPVIFMFPMPSNILLKDFFFLYHVFLPSTHFKFNSSLFRSLKSKYTFSLFKLSSFTLLASSSLFKLSSFNIFLSVFMPSTPVCKC